MVVYGDNVNDNILKFVEKILLLTSENKLIWEQIRTDNPTYITKKPFMMKNREFYATLQDCSLHLKLDVDYTNYALKNNTDKINQIPVLFQIKSYNSNYKINQLLKSLSENIKAQINVYKKDKLQKETEKVEDFISSFLDENKESEQ